MSCWINQTVLKKVQTHAGTQREQNMTTNSNPNLLFKSKSLQAKDAISPCYGALPVDTSVSLLVNHCKQGTWKHDQVSGNKDQSQV